MNIVKWVAIPYFAVYVYQFWRRIDN